MPSLLKLTNNAVGRLASNRSTTDTSLILQAGEGVRFPSLAAGEFFRATLVRSSDGAIEIVNVTARATDTLTVTRAQEGTTALAFLAGDRVELRLTAGAFQYNADWLEAFAANANNLASGTVPAARLTGTYNISISGNAATATNATQLGGVAASGYARTDGAGASGTWNISISGNATNADQLDGIDSSGFTRTTGISSLGTFAQTSGNSIGGFAGIVEATNAASGFGTATAFDARLHGVLVGGVHFTDTGDGGCEVSIDYTPPGDPNTDRRVFAGLRLRNDGICEAKGFLPTGGAGAVGTYAILFSPFSVTYDANYAGSSLREQGMARSAENILLTANGTGNLQTGTWKCLGSFGSSTGGLALFLKIA